jgi:Tol biopolymer transport system component
VTGLLFVVSLFAAFGPGGAAPQPTDGRIAFAAPEGLYVLTGGAEAPLPNGEGGSWPAWSPDGTRVAFTSIRKGGLYVMNADGTALRRVTRSPTLDIQPTWSPDGRSLAFVRAVPGFNLEIFSIRVDGRGLRRLTRNRGDDAEPSWSPNGKRIAWSFGATRRGTVAGIYTMAPNGTAKRYRGPGLAPDWSPDGTRFVFAHDGDLWTSTVTGDERTRLTAASGSDARQVWSPDGTQIAFVSSQGSPTDQYRLWRVDITGTNRRLLAPEHESVSSASWARS